MKTAASGAIYWPPKAKQTADGTRITLSVKSERAKNPYQVVVDMDDYSLAVFIGELKKAAEERAKIHDRRAEMLRNA